MNTAVSPAIFTPEDLLGMPDGDRYELVNGHLVERNMSTLASFVAGNVHTLLANHSHQKQPGWPFPEGTSYQCFPGDPKKVRKADVSFFHWDRRTLADIRTEGHCPLAPDLAVEVVSPNDEAYEVDEKVQEWLDAGVRCVWVVNPLRQTVQVHRADGTGTILRSKDAISGEDAVPGFQCKVADFFAAPEAKKAVS